MPAHGWINKFAFEDNALTADALGRAAMEDGYIQNQKVEDGTLTVAKLSSTLLKYLLSVGRVGYAHVDYCKVG